MQAVAAKLGIVSRETLRNWVKQHEVDAGTRPGATSEEPAGTGRLRAGNAELRWAHEILKAASVFFVAGPDRPSERSQRFSTLTGRRSESSRSAQSRPAGD